MQYIPYSNNQHTYIHTVLNITYNINIRVQYIYNELVPTKRTTVLLFGVACQSEGHQVLQFKKLNWVNLLLCERKTKVAHTYGLINSHMKLSNDED